MELLLSQFDPDKNAIIDPEMTCTPIENFPERCVCSFSPTLIEAFAKMDGVTQIGSLMNANAILPIYQIDYKGTPIAFCMARVGAPACIGGVEELIAMGCKKLVVFGSCGVLNHEIADEHIIVPTSAMRDEGTSYHYMPPSDEIELDTDCVNSITSTIDALGYPYIKGKVWTTDAFYRETKAKLQTRKEQGCIAVEMECSALVAVAKFRGIQFGEFLYSADNLASPTWDARGLAHHHLSSREKFMALALECVLNL